MVQEDRENHSLNPRVGDNALHGGEEDGGAGADTAGAGVKKVLAAISEQ